MPAVPIHRFAFVTIYTRDLAAAKAFYVECLGFPVLRDGAQAYVEIDVAGVPVCIDVSADPIHPNTIAVEVEDLATTEKVFRKLGFKPHSGSNAASREQWLELKDPDGNLLVFLAPPAGTRVAAR